MSAEVILIHRSDAVFPHEEGLPEHAYAFPVRDLGGGVTLVVGCEDETRAAELLAKWRRAQARRAQRPVTGPYAA